MRYFKILLLVNSAILLFISATANADVSLEAFMTIDQSKVTNGSSLAISVTSMGGKGEVNYQLWLNNKAIPVDGLGQAVITGKQLGNNHLTLVANTATEQATAKAQFKVVAGLPREASVLPSLADIKASYKDNHADKVSLIKKPATKQSTQ